MGEVWAGTHRQLGLPVAVKFLTAEGLRERDFVRAFRTEIRAVATLDHPAIVRVHDFGEVANATARATGGRIPEGSPWLAMERVGAGTLAPIVGRLRWSEVRSVVLALLDGLAHAHARGVVHRDLKPGNVLVDEQDDTDSLLVKLTDFGLAQAVDERGEVDVPFAGGTPAYMAPEQFDSRWRDFGPWSDLYALGTLAWSLVTGEPPFGREASAKRRAHMLATPPRLMPTCDVPPGLEAWLRRLLEKDPADRYRRAADARFDFLALGQATVASQRIAHGPQADVDTLVLDPHGPPPALADVPTLTHRMRADEAVLLPLGPLRTDKPPLPPTWTGARHDDDAPPMGLGLFGLRPVPLVDRRPERDALWQALVRTARDGAVHAVVLRGHSGVGKTRLARWLGEQAHEAGAATPLWARHRAVAGPDQGLGAMLRGFTRCHGLSRDAVRRRIGALYGRLGVDHRDEWHALTEVISPATSDDEAEVRFASLMERYVTMRRLLQRVCAERPVIVVLDDAQWGVDALRFADYLLGYEGTRHPLPILLVVTVDDGALPERIDAATALEELLARERCTSLGIGPLPPEHRADLVRGILGLEPGLAERVESHTRGNPLFAVELVGDWVQDGLLETSPEGFRARGRLILPADVEAMWRQRVARLDEELTRGESRALELAAVLGMDVDPDEWAAACHRAVRANPSDAMVQRLLHRGLAEVHPERESAWSFAHPSLRQAVLARSASEGRLTAWHELVAMLLQEQVRSLPAWPRGLAERVGMHYLGADAPSSAIPHLLDGIEERRHGGDYAIALRLLDRYEQALRRSGVPEHDVRWGQGWVQRYEIAHLRGENAEADRWLQVASAEARRHRWTSLELRTRHFRARLQRLAGDYEGALAALKSLEQAAARAGDREIMARCREEAGEAMLESGDVPAAEHWLRLALAEYRSMGHDIGCASAWRRLGDALKERGAYDEANELLLQAERQLSTLGHRVGMAEALNSRGDVARAQGDLRTAVRLYRRSRGLFKAIGSSVWIFPEYNTAIAHLEAGHLERARPILELSLHRFRKAGHQPATAHAHLALAWCAARDRAWSRWDEHVAAARGALGRTGYADEDTARLARRVGELAHEQGQRDRALNAWSLSRSLWRILDRHPELQAVERLLTHQDR